MSHGDRNTVTVTFNGADREVEYQSHAAVDDDAAAVDDGDPVAVLGLIEVVRGQEDLVIPSVRRSWSM